MNILNYSGLKYLMFIIVALFIASCSPRIQQIKTTEVSDPPSGLKLSKIEVLDLTNSTQIILEADETIQYTSYTLNEPPRLVIDISDISVGEFREPIEVNKGSIIGIYPVETDSPAKAARLDIRLVDDSIESQIYRKENSVVIEIPKKAEEISEQDTSGSVPVSISTDTDEITKGDEAITGGMIVNEVMAQTDVKTETGTVPEVNTETKTENEAVPKKEEFTYIKEIKIEKIDNKTIIVVNADKEINAETFLVEGNKVVIDVKNAVYIPNVSEVPVDNNNLLSKVRIGRHLAPVNKVRIVGDLKEKITYETNKEENVFTLSILGKSNSKPADKVISEPVPESEEDVPSNQTSQQAQEPLAVPSQPPAVTSSPIPAPIPVSAPIPSNETTAPLPKETVIVSREQEAPAQSITPAPAQEAVPAVSTAPAQVEVTAASPAPAKAVVPAPAALPVPAPPAAPEKVVQKTVKNKKANSSSEDITGPSIVRIPKYTGKKVSLDFQDADIINVLRLLAEVSKLNMIIGEGVKGKVTIKMLDVPWDHALDVILKIKGLGKVFEDNVLRVDTLSNIAQQQEEEAKAKEAMVKAEDLVTRIYPVSYARAKDISDSIKKTLSTRGDITVDDRTNTMIIKDIKDKHTEINRLLETLDKPTPQVLIEARIVQADSNFARDLGIQWGGSHSTTSGDYSMGIVGGPTGTVGGPTPGFVVSLPAAGRAGTKGSLGFTIGKTIGDDITLDLRLSAGETKGLTKVLSAPKIATLDNREAMIQQGESIPYKTYSQEGTKTEFIDATLTLKVTPKVTPDGHISMNIRISKNRPGSMVVEGTPSVNKKEATTEVLVKDGETTVIGGIYELEEKDDVSGVPWFYKIPVFGWLFKNTQKSNAKSELLIFITPKIIPVST